jgi:hypothetical protein
MTVAHPHVGMVIPVWYPAEAAPELVATLLASTLDGVDQYCSPEHVVLVLDGQACWEEAVRTEAVIRGHPYHALPTNQGKGAAVAVGIAVLEAADLRFIVTRDGDGAHLISDLPALLELAELMTAETGNSFLFVAGGRRDRVHALGFARAEYEHVTDRVLWQALQYHAAREGRMLRGTYFAPHDDWPDLQSGYKVYSAAAARLAAQVLRAAGQGSRDGGLARCGVETLPAVVILSRGGQIGQVTRPGLPGVAGVGLSGHGPAAHVRRAVALGAASPADPE